MGLNWFRTCTDDFPFAVPTSAEEWAVLVTLWCYIGTSQAMTWHTQIPPIFGRSHFHPGPPELYYYKPHLPLQYSCASSCVCLFLTLWALVIAGSSTSIYVDLIQGALCPVQFCFCPHSVCFRLTLKYRAFKESLFSIGCKFDSLIKISLSWHRTLCKGANNKNIKHSK